MKALRVVRSHSRSPESTLRSVPSARAINSSGTPAGLSSRARADASAIRTCIEGSWSTGWGPIPLRSRGIAAREPSDPSRRAAPIATPVSSSRSACSRVGSAPGSSRVTSSRSAESRLHGVGGASGLAGSPDFESGAPSGDGSDGAAWATPTAVRRETGAVVGSRTGSRSRSRCGAPSEAWGSHSSWRQNHASSGRRRSAPSDCGVGPHPSKRKSARPKKALRRGVRALPGTIDDPVSVLIGCSLTWRPRGRYLTSFSASVGTACAEPAPTRRVNR